MKKTAAVLAVLVLAASASATVRIIVEDLDGMAAIKYVTDGEKVRAFALDITVDAGVITGIDGFHRGESTAAEPGYGIFPAAFSKAIHVDPLTGEVSAWDVNDYTPLADPCDCPAGTLKGLNTSGVTVEMGALYSPPTDNSANAPGNAGLLCVLLLSEKANVSVVPNACRGGVVLTTVKPATLDITKATAVPVDPAKKP